MEKVAKLVPQARLFTIEEHDYINYNQFHPTFTKPLSFNAAGHLGTMKNLVRNYASTYSGPIANLQAYLEDLKLDDVSDDAL